MRPILRLLILGLFLGGSLTAALLFLPQDRLCNALLDQLARHKITLCAQKRETALFRCRMEQTTLSYMQTPVATLRQIRLSPRAVEADGVTLTGMAASLFPPRIDRIVADPWRGHLEAEGAFGRLEGSIDWRKGKIELILTPSLLMRRSYRSTLQRFRRKKGQYLYEITF